MPRTFDEAALLTQTDKASCGYGPLYDRHVLSLMGRDSPVSLLEIGVHNGASLRLWEALWPNARVYGIDIDPRCKASESAQSKVFIGDQGDSEFLRSVLLEVKPPVDFVVDDGSHNFSDILISFTTLWPHVSKCYVIEDIWHEHAKAIEAKVRDSCANVFAYASRVEKRSSIFAVK